MAGGGFLKISSSIGPAVAFSAIAPTPMPVAATIAALWELFYWMMRLGLIGGRSED